MVSESSPGEQIKRFAWKNHTTSWKWLGPLIFLGLGLIGGDRYVRFHATYFISDSPVPLLIALAIATTWSVFLWRKHRSSVSGLPASSQLDLGADGLVLDDIFVAWRDFRGVDRTSAGFCVDSARYGQLIGARLQDAETVLGHVAAAYADYLTLPEPPNWNVNAPQSQHGPYRGSQRRDLLLVATSPKSPPAARLAAAQALARDPDAQQEVFDSLTGHVDGSTVQRITAALHEARPPARG